MVAEWAQRFNTYLLDTNNIVIDPQVLWDASSSGSRFGVTDVVPPNLVPADKNVFSIGPLTEDRNIAVYCSHRRPGSNQYMESDPRHTFVRLYKTLGCRLSFVLTYLPASVQDRQ